MALKGCAQACPLQSRICGSIINERVAARGMKGWRVARRGASQNAATARALHEGGAHVTALQRPPGQLNSPASLQGWVTGGRGGGAGGRTGAAPISHPPPSPAPPAPSRPVRARVAPPSSRKPELRIAGVPAGPGSPRPRRLFLCPGASAAAAELACRRGGRALPGAPAPSRGDRGRTGGARKGGRALRRQPWITARLGQVAAPARPQFPYLG